MSTETQMPQTLQGMALVLSATAISIVAFAEVLDMTIVNVAVPSIAGEFGASAAEGTWTISSYAMAAAAMQPLTGWLSRRLGQIRLFLLASALFTLASILCGMAWSLGSLVTFRILQGVVSGPLLPLSQSLMLASFPTERRGFALGLWAATVLTAPIFGPILGGWITDNWSWRACFYINLPIGLFSTVTLWVLLRRRDNQPVREPIDFVGATLLIVGIVALQFMLDHGNQEAWFESALIVGLAVVCVLALTLFATWERFERFPIVDFSLFRHGNFAVGVVASSIGHAAFFASMVIHPLWLQTVGGYTASQAGLAIAGYGGMAMLTSLLFGAVIHRVSLRMTATFGLLMFAAGSVMLAQLTTESSFWDHFWSRMPQGVGMPMLQMSLTSWSMGSLPVSRYPAAAGLMSFFRTLGGAFAAALTIWAWDYRSTVHHSLLAEGFNAVQAANSAVFVDAVRAGASLQSMGILEALVQIKARTLAFADVSWMTAGLFVLIIAMLWLTPGRRVSAD